MRALTALAYTLFAFHILVDSSSTLACAIDGSSAAVTDAARCSAAFQLPRENS
jgi:hypothetical protein